jgi:hypothetical protein
MEMVTCGWQGSPQRRCNVNAGSCMCCRSGPVMAPVSTTHMHQPGHASQHSPSPAQSHLRGGLPALLIRAPPVHPVWRECDAQQRVEGCFFPPAHNVRASACVRWYRGSGTVRMKQQSRKPDGSWNVQGLWHSQAKYVVGLLLRILLVLASRAFQPGAQSALQGTVGALQPYFSLMCA